VLSALQKECRKVWGARYTLGARYRSENTVVHLDAISGCFAQFQKDAMLVLQSWEIIMVENKTIIVCLFL